MRTAIIDMGTNTFHLMVSDFQVTEYQILWNEKIPVKLGAGGINRKTITDDAIERAIATLKNFRMKADELGAQEIYAFGTSALRNAANKNFVIDEIKKETGIQTKIISGHEEAEYIYKGVNLALKLNQEKVLIVDIGGGSVEFIIANGSEIFWKESFEVGGQRLLERFQKHDPILASEIDQVVSHLNEFLSPLADAMQIHTPKILAGSSGTFDTLSEIYCKQSGIAYLEEPETPFNQQAFHKIYHQVTSKNRTERMQIPGMIELRVDMIVVACVLVKFILDRFSFDQVRVSSYSLKEGVLASLLKS